MGLRRLYTLTPYWAESVYITKIGGPTGGVEDREQKKPLLGLPYLWERASPEIIFLAARDLTQDIR
jgi:hypothetical protein